MADIIKGEQCNIDGRTHTWSDAGLYIRQNGSGALYEDAMDVPGLHTYAETDIPIEDWEEPEEPMTSSKNIENGVYFSAGNKLFLSTATIAAGETIVPGGNCEEISVAQALNDLKED